VWQSVSRGVTGNAATQAKNFSGAIPTTPARRHLRASFSSRLLEARAWEVFCKPSCTVGVDAAAVSTEPRGDHVVTSIRASTAGRFLCRKPIGIAQVVGEEARAADFVRAAREAPSLMLAPSPTSFRSPSHESRARRRATASSLQALPLLSFRRIHDLVRPRHPLAGRFSRHPTAAGYDDGGSRTSNQRAARAPPLSSCHAAIGVSACADEPERVSTGSSTPRRGGSWPIDRRSAPPGFSDAWD